MTSSGNIVRRWQIQLARRLRSMPKPDSPEYWPQLLHIRVLRYLIRRYAIRESWNRHAKLPDTKSKSESRNYDQTRGHFVISKGAGRPPKHVLSIKRALERLSEENIESYNDFGIPLNDS